MFLNLKKKILRIIFNITKINCKINFLPNELPKKSLFISNHVSYLDPILMFAFLPGNPVLALNSYLLRKTWIKWLIKGADIIEFNPIDPTSIKKIISIINQGRNCFLFPEGKMTKNGALMKIYEATGLIADKAKAPIIPIWIEGMQYSYYSNLKNKFPLRRFPRTTIFIDKPINFNLNDEFRRQRDYLSNSIYKILIDLAFKTRFEEKESVFSMLVKARKIYNKTSGLFSKAFIVEDSKRKPQSYKNLIIKSFILGNYFKKYFAHQENIGILLPNSIAHLCTFLGLIAYERTPTILNFSAGILNIISMCKTAVVKNLITSKEFIEVAKLEDTLIAIEKIGINIIYLEDIAKTFNIFNKIKALYQYKFKKIPYTDSGDKKCVILFTSGSEGDPKAVVLTHTNIVANITQCKCVFDINNTDLLFNILPMFHSFGLTVATLYPLMVGSKVFLYPSPLHYRIIPELIYETNATGLIATDTFFRGYSKVAHPYDFNSLKLILGGAEAVKNDNRTVWSERFGLRLLEGYGTTECAPVLTANNLVFCKFGSIGQLFPGIEYKIKPIDGYNDGGILCVKGPNIMKGYYYANNPGILKSLEDNGNWYETGDIVSVDSAGYFYIKDRLKRFAKIAGEMISLNAVENMVEKAFNSNEEEFEYAAVAIPHETKGEQIILATNNNQLTQELLYKYVQNQGISELFLPKKIIYKQNFPIFATGKRNNVKLKEEILSELKINID